MSKLRQSVLEYIRIAGNYSGCHQRADRSFFYKGKQFPVCARCTGVFLGEALAVILGLLRVFISPGISVLLLLPMGFDWLLQELRIKESTNVRRLLTGFLGGFGLFSLYFLGLRRLAAWIMGRQRNH